MTEKLTGQAPPPWMLERLALGERVETGGLDAEALKTGLAALEQRNSEFFARYPADRIVPQIRRRAEAQPPRSRRVPFALLMTLGSGALAALLFVIPRLGTESTRLKGAGPVLSVYRNASGHIERLRDQDRVNPGDVLQIGYAAMGRKYGAILSIDGARQVTLHFPRTSGAAPKLQASGEAVLSQAYKLDAAPRFERFVFVTSDRPFAVDDALAAARAVAQSGEPAAGSPLALPREVEQTSVLLRKDGP